jgi:hypothetical protein
MEPGGILEIAKRLGLPIPEAYRDEVIAYYRRLLEQVALVMAAPLPETAHDRPADFVP